MILLVSSRTVCVEKYDTLRIMWNNMYRKRRYFLNCSSRYIYNTFNIVLSGYLEIFFTVRKGIVLEQSILQVSYWNIYMILTVSFETISIEKHDSLCIMINGTRRKKRYFSISLTLWYSIRFSLWYPTGNVGGIFCARFTAVKRMINKLR